MTTASTMTVLKAIASAQFKPMGEGDYFLFEVAEGEGEGEIAYVEDAALATALGLSSCNPFKASELVAIVKSPVMIEMVVSEEESGESHSFTISIEQLF